MKYLNIKLSHNKNIIKRNILPAIQIKTKQLLLSKKYKYMLDYLNIKRTDSTINDISKLWIVTETKEAYIIKIESNLIIKNMKSDELCNLINDGNLEVQGTHLFDEAVNYVKRNFNLFLMAGGDLFNEK